MPLEGIKQPDIIQVNEKVRLRKRHAGEYMPGVPWYQDYEVYYNDMGITEEEDIPDEENVKWMYEQLENMGENYFIEILEDGIFVPIGDVLLAHENPCIVIGAAKYRGVGIGRAVMTALLARAKDIGIKKITGTQIYTYNIKSQKLFESLGFKCVSKAGDELIYELNLEEIEMLNEALL